MRTAGNGGEGTGAGEASGQPRQDSIGPPGTAAAGENGPNWAFGIARAAVVISWTRCSTLAVRVQARGVSSHVVARKSASLTPLAGAYEFAAREWLDPDGSGHPYENLPSEQFAERWVHLETGANRAFLLYAVVPTAEDDEVGAMLHTLLLCALAQVGNRQADFRRWLAARHRDNGHEDPAASWDAILLRRVVRLQNKRDVDRFVTRH